MRIALFAATLATVASPALAQDFYGSVFGGYSSLNNPTFSGDVTPPGGPQTVGTDFGSGFSFGIAVGTSFAALSRPGLGVRGELELSYTDSDVDNIAFSGNGPASENNVAGGIDTTRLFANIIADVETASKLTPYFGLGLGISRSDLGLSYGGFPGAVRVEDSSTNFSAQLIAGASYAINDDVSLFGDARYIRDFNVDSDRFSPAGLTGNIEDDIDTVNVNFGVRFKF